MGAPEPQTQSAAIAKRFQCGACRKTDGHNRTTCPLLRTLCAQEPAAWGKIAAGTCSLSNRGRTVTRLGDAAHPRAYARSRLPAEGTCTIDVALDKLQPGGKSISVGVVHAGGVGEQPLEAVGACQKEAGISWRNASAKSRGRVRSSFGGQDVSADIVCGALKARGVVSVTWDGNTRAVWWVEKLGDNLWSADPAPGRILHRCKLRQRYCRDHQPPGTASGQNEEGGAELQ